MPVISTNLAANSAVRYLNINSISQTSSLSKLASGSRITQASDDAAGLAISTKISSDVMALNQAATNASHGVSVLQTADGGAANISDILQRMKALASQSASGTVTDNERIYIDAEYQQLIDEVDAISSGTRYNGQSLLDGSSHFADSGIDVIVGSDAADVINVNLVTLDAAKLGLIEPLHGYLSFGLTPNAHDLIETWLSALDGETPPDMVLDVGAGLDATGGDIVFEVNDVPVTLLAAGGIYSAADVSQAITDALLLDGTVTTVTASAAGTTITLANSEVHDPGLGNYPVIKLDGFSGFGTVIEDLGIDAWLDVDAWLAGGEAWIAARTSLATQPGALAMLATLDGALNAVSTARADIGSLESRFGFHQASIATSVENLTAAISAIKDIDIAQEAAKLASSKVKTQAAVAAAAQASQMPQDLLKLLQ